MHPQPPAAASPCPLLPPKQAPLTDAEPLPSLEAFPPSPGAPGWGGCERQGALPDVHSLSRLVPVPRMLFPDMAGLLGQQEGRRGRHTVAPCCLLTASCCELVPQEAAVGESILSPPPGKPSTDHNLLHRTRNVSVPAGIILCKQYFMDKSLVRPQQSCQALALRRG